jgi:hypothetical protein
MIVGGWQLAVGGWQKINHLTFTFPHFHNTTSAHFIYAGKAGTNERSPHRNTGIMVN